MPKTLFKVVKQVEDAYDEVAKYTAVDKNSSIRAIFDEWAKNNSVVHAVLNGEATFIEQHQQNLQEYGSWRKAFIPYILPPSFKEKITDLEACIGNSNFEIGYTPIENPVGIGALFSTILGIGSGLATKKHLETIKMSRRSFIINGVASGAILGGLVGIMPPSLKLYKLHVLRQNAEYLDNVYGRLYQKS